MKTFAPNQLDFYKVGHINQYPTDTQYVYSNLTARSGKYSNVNSKGVIFVGLQEFLISYLQDDWNNTFFNKPIDEVVSKFERIVSTALGYTVDVSHMRKLHELGYLPVKIKALPEGSFVPYGIPMMTITSTHPDFFWVTNMLESVLSSEIWLGITSATTYFHYRKLFEEYASETCANNLHVPYQGHDFSFRGMSCKEAAAKSSFGALACGSKGTDTVPAISLAEDYYHAEGFIAGSVNATEHSVMCSGFEDEEIYTFNRLMSEVYPTGILSIVSDTWDFWKVVSDYLPRLKNIILQRKGKIVIRPDSGDPADIICGTGEKVDPDVEYSLQKSKGLIECLWDIFGGDVNSKGYKVLNPHIGAIYGDSITFEVASDILKRLKDKGFASSEIVLGIGSYTYQYVTRDTHGMAIKATNLIRNGTPFPIQKDPKTDDGLKKSATGLLMVTDSGGRYTLKQKCSPKEESRGCLETVFIDGTLTNETTLKAIRERVNLIE